MMALCGAFSRLPIRSAAMRLIMGFSGLRCVHSHYHTSVNQCLTFPPEVFLRNLFLRKPVFLSVDPLGIR